MKPAGTGDPQVSFTLLIKDSEVFKIKEPLGQFKQLSFEYTQKIQDKTFRFG